MNATHRNLRGFLYCLLAGVTALAVANGGLRAQSIYSGIRGIVTDPSEAVVANAKVTLTNQGTSAERTTQTDNLGEYVFSQVIPGVYTVSVQTQGFKKVERKGIVLETQNQLTIDMELQVGNIAESVVVAAETPLVETATASQGQVIDNQKLVDLPNIGRNPFMMSKLAPNIQQVGNPAYMRMQDQTGSSQISLAGGPVRGNNYLLDGVPITDMRNRAVIIASLEAVQEMKVQTNTYDAEIGRTGGGMFNVLLRSGTNSYHGSLGALIRQTDWEANAFFANRSGTPRTEQPNRTYYGSFGGPIQIPKLYKGKDRTFFWVALEGYHDTQGASGSTAVPTLAERTGDFSKSFDRNGNLVIQYDPLAARDANGNRTPFPNNIIPAARLDKAGLAIAATFGNPTTTAPFGVNNAAYSGLLPSRAGQGTVKVDQQITSRWNVNVSYLHYHSNEPGENWFPYSSSSPEQWVLDRNVNATQVNNTIMVNPTTIVAVRYGFNRFPNDLTTRSQGFNLASLGFGPTLVNSIPRPQFPIVTFQNYYPGNQMGGAAGGGGNNGFFVPYSRNFVASLAKVMGRHSLKLGADWRSISNDGIDYDGSRGAVAFDFDDRFTRRNATATGGGSDLASLLLGYPAVATAFRSTKLFENIGYYSAFVQDDIRFNPRLTINVGLRWEHETGLKERKDNLIVGFDPNAQNSLGAKVGVPVRGAVEFAGQNGYPNQTGNYTFNKLSPRFGLSYQVNPKTIVRGGWGLFWAPPIAINNPYTPEGATATTTPLASNDGFNTPLIQLANPFPNGLTAPAGTSNGDATGLGINLTVFDRNARSTYIQQFSFDVQRELPSNVAVSVAYVGSRSYRLMLGTPDLNINQLEPKYASLGSTALSQRVNNPYYVQGGPGIIGSAQVTQSQLLRPFPAFGNINLTGSDQNKAQYDSLVLKAQKRYSAGLTFLTAYTWSKNFDRSSGGAGSNVNAGSKGPQNVYDLRSEWGLAIVDATHRFSMTGSYELPFGRNKQLLGSVNRMADLAVGGWSINVVTVISSGFPLVISQSSNNNSANLFSVSQRPNATGIAPQTDGSVGQRLDNWINKDAFSTAPALTFGNLSRTVSERGPGQFNWDISVFKNFPVYERFKVQFRAEALNAFNTPYFRSPNTSFGSSNFGRVLSQGNFPRFIQLGLRLQF
ncbi:MAG: TonB-dependent receptor [Terriglobia bacterium]|nr:MAG: TonB-dependent receptor [Terriglobia bacterium]